MSHQHRHELVRTQAVPGGTLLIGRCTVDGCHHWRSRVTPHDVVEREASPSAGWEETYQQMGADTSAEADGGTVLSPATDKAQKDKQKPHTALRGVEDDGEKPHLARDFSSGRDPHESTGIKSCDCRKRGVCDCEETMQEHDLIGGSE
jgi:hypothetical protein